MIDTIEQVNWHHAVIKSGLFAALPRTLLLRRGDRARKEFALTFDDGPHPDYTPRALEILRTYGVAASFFLLGSRAEKHPELVKAILADGHEIGSHSYSHPHFNRLSFSEAAHEVGKSKALLERLTGQQCRLFRPPYGKLALQSLIPAWLKRQSVILWSVDLKDYRGQSVDNIHRRLAVRRIRNGDIVLYHGENDAALSALPRVLETAQSDGKKGLSVSQIAGLDSFF